jgi:DNA-binding CsgD family transcriptional regulator
MGDKPNLVVALLGLGKLDLDEGDPVAARVRFAEALRITQGYGQVGNHAGALEGLAAVAAAVAPAHALRLAGAAARLRAAAGHPVPDDEQAALDRRLRPAWALLGESAGAAAWAAGEALSYEEAGAEGLREVGPVDPPRPPEGEAPGAPLPGGLSAREAEVLRLVAEGLPDATVAARLNVSPRTVHAHLRAIYGKLGIASRSAATRWAVEHGLT